MSDLVMGTYKAVFNVQHVFGTILLLRHGGVRGVTIYCLLAWIGHFLRVLGCYDTTNNNQS